MQTSQGAMAATTDEFLRRESALCETAAGLTLLEKGSGR
jgi:hypothetical protein